MIPVPFRYVAKANDRLFLNTSIREYKNKIELKVIMIAQTREGIHFQAKRKYITNPEKIK